MSNDLPAITGREVIRAFEKAGFVEARQRGSHVILKKPGHPYLITVPVHSGRTVGRGLLRGLIQDAGLTVQQFLNLL